MEELNNVRFNRINYPKGGLTVVEAGKWTPLGPFLKRPRRWEDKEVVDQEKICSH
ncbi:TPA: hypothetical protein QCN93_005325 [Bacillus pacificus]|nr:hypothetical protein [Bacillus pacificus]